MVQVFSSEEKQAARKQKAKLLWIYFGILFIYAVSVAVVMIFQTRQNQMIMGAINIITTIAMGWFTMFFFAIKFRLTRKYVRMLKDIEIGLKDEIVAKFIEYDNTVSMKDGVYFYSMVLDCKPLKREDITMRKLLIEQTKPKIELEPGTKLKILSHANILVAYEII